MAPADPASDPTNTPPSGPSHDPVAPGPGTPPPAPAVAPASAVAPDLAAPASAAAPAPAPVPAPAADPAAIDPTAATQALNDPTRLMSIGLGSTGTGIRKRWTPPAPADLPPIPNLVVEAIIGIGGMGAVYRARQTHLDRVVALKVLDPAHLGDAVFAERFAREARAMARLDHPAIVRLYDYGQTGAYPWLVMELIEGATLREVLRTGNLSAAEALRIAPQLCDALAHAHANGVVHRDLKPENILLDGRGRPKIADFGLAKLHDDVGSLTATGTVMGTAQYMAPEQIAGAASVDHRADLYALGVVIYEMLTGVLPLGRFAPPSQSSGVDARYDEVVLRSLEREPGRRWQTADDVRRAMDAASEIVPPAAKSASAPQAATAAEAPAAKPGDGGEKARKKNSSVHVGPIHVSDDEVRIGDGLVINEDGVRVGDKVVIGNQTVIAPHGDITVNEQGSFGPVPALNRKGILLILGGTLLMAMHMADISSASERNQGILWAAAAFMTMAGLSLVLRAARFLVVIGVVAVTVAMWLSFYQHIWVFAGLVWVLTEVIGMVTNPPEFERHYRARPGERRIARRFFMVALIAVGAFVALLPFGNMKSLITPPAPPAAVSDHALNDVRHIANTGDANFETTLASWFGPALPSAARYQVSIHLRAKDVADRAHLELWTQLANGQRISSPQVKLASGDDWQDVIMTADAGGIDSAIMSVFVQIDLPGRGAVDVAMPVEIKAMAPTGTATATAAQAATGQDSPADRAARAQADADATAAAERAGAERPGEASDGNGKSSY